ncbi:MAG: hypothetical protein LKF93_06995 [Bifidobacterium tibiigranuli]|jgi:hypothetical protein|nr:hypothetical protein [Bifidobacterium tibiigranuli]
MRHADAAPRLPIGIMRRDIPNLERHRIRGTIQRRSQPLHIQPLIIAFPRLKDAIQRERHHRFLARPIAARACGGVGSAHESRIAGVVWVAGLDALFGYLLSAWQSQC